MRLTGARSAEPLIVECHLHGRQVSAVVCQHLLQEFPAPLGLVENSNDPNDLQAWCHLCEHKYQQQVGLTDAFDAFNDIAIVCTVCYARIKVRHLIAAN